jgi:hypothetical protein
MQITLNLKDLSATDFANCYGFDGTVSIEDFITSKMLDYVANAVLENANRQAIANVVKVEDVTSDGSQITLKESIATAMATKLKPTEVTEVVK